MSKFLIIPISDASQGFRTGAVFYEASKTWVKDSQYLRVLGRELSVTDTQLIKNLGIKNAYAITPEALDHQLVCGNPIELEEKLATYFLTHQKSQSCLWVEGFSVEYNQPYLFALNRYLASILKAELIFCLDVAQMTAEGAALSLQAVLRFFFENDCNPLGFVLLNVQGDIENYVAEVESHLQRSGSPLRSLLAVPNALNQIKNSNDVAAISSEIKENFLQDALNKAPDERMAPAVYRVKVIEKAREAKKSIILPEGSEPRTVQAAIICHQKRIAHCVLLTKQEELQSTLSLLGLRLPNDIQVIDPDSIRNKYLARLLKLRQHKGLTEDQARNLLLDNIFVGTMMLENGEVDGLVSGAVHTTASTIRPALQVIKLAPSASVVSSVFFMLLPNEVLIFGDCAVNVELTAEQLAEVAIQSADSARAFDIDPKVALISYSTKDSGSGVSVDKVKKALSIVQAKRSDIVIDGPLQYDAALVPSIASKKAPGSPVAGQANVFIFPDLNTGNTVYKAVQRTGHIVSVGPMLQGLRKPVNDLSRGAMVDDIVFTIAIAAIQASQQNLR